MIGCSYLNRDHAGHFTSAVFLDRDGTISDYNGYITRADQLRLAEGTGESLRDLVNAGYYCIVVTNQSAIGRGMMTELQLQPVHERLLDLLAAEGATLSAIYYCPDLPDSDDEFTVTNPDRKPGAGMLRRAAVDLKLNLSSSWMIGDRYSDVLAGSHAGCRGSIRLLSGHPSQPLPHGRIMPSHESFDDLPAATEFILQGQRP